MNNSMYLVGQISAVFPETYDWRKRVKKYFGNNERYYIMDPCANAFNQAVQDAKMDRKEILDGSMKWEETDGIKFQGVNMLVPKDRTFVAKADIIMANMNQYDPDRPLLGSFFELAWAYDCPTTTVVGIYNGDPKDDYVCAHPFVWQAVDAWAKDEQEACRLIDYYFT